MGKNINVSGALTPTVADTPIDARSRIDTIDDIVNIAYPYVGMVVYVRDTKKRYEVTELGSKMIGTIEIPNSVVKSYSEVGADVKEELQQLRSEIASIKGDEASEEAETSEIDSLKEMKEFLAGYDNTQRLSDVMDANHALTDEEMNTLKSLFPTE